MHMISALVTPAIGGVMLATSAVTAGKSLKKLKSEDLLASKKVPLMGVVGAFVFAAQMVNFAVPLTGSSGHFVGGLLLAALLGPHAGFLVMSAILAVQALFFADGGLLALGCNIFNMGVLPCFVAYRFIFKPLTDKARGRGGILAASFAGAAVGLLLGALGVVIETAASGVAGLPFGVFAGAMLPIHLAIGVAEGAITAAILFFVRTRQDALPRIGYEASHANIKKVMTGLAVLAVILAGFVSTFASPQPDGLEWAISRAAGGELRAGNPMYASLEGIEQKISPMPGYGFKGAGGTKGAINAAGLVGSAAVMCACAAVGYLVVAAQKKDART